MRMLFLAVGDLRQIAVIDEANEVLRAGGSATILLSDRAAWQDVSFPDGAEVIDVRGLDPERLPIRLERMIVFGVPRRLLGAADRGPLRGRARRVLKAYERRIAKPVHRRVKARLAGPDQRHKRVLAMVSAGRFDYLNVTDARSIPMAARIVADLGAAPTAPKITFGIDYL